MSKHNQTPAKLLRDLIDMYCRRKELWLEGFLVKAKIMPCHTTRASEGHGEQYSRNRDEIIAFREIKHISNIHRRFSILDRNTGFTSLPNDHVGFPMLVASLVLTKPEYFYGRSNVRMGDLCSWQTPKWNDFHKLGWSKLIIASR